ncbi:MAG: hypothetical protein KAQ92_02510 [Candidatus Aenigmarchaeota archaeon]|nr:hypothetical protein [Candidatus Aenigmarchaeota archaeon]
MPEKTKEETKPVEEKEEDAKLVEEKEEDSKSVEEKVPEVKKKPAPVKKKEVPYTFSKNKDGFVEVKFSEDSCGLSTMIAEELWDVKGVVFSAQKRGHILIDKPKLIFKAKDEKKALLDAISSVEKKLDELKKKI